MDTTFSYSSNSDWQQKIKRKDRVIQEETGSLSRLYGGIIFCVSFALFVTAVLALLTYSPTDPGFSHVSTRTHVSNLLGPQGAWCADFIYLLFGWGAWVLVLGIVLFLMRGWRRLWGTPAKRNELPFGLRIFSFVLLVLCSSSLCFLRFHSMGEALPATTGGLVGSTLGSLALKGFGFELSTALLIVLCAVFSSLFFGFSWVSFAEAVGAKFCGLITRVKDKNEEWKDQEISRIVKADREKSKSATSGLKNFFNISRSEEKAAPAPLPAFEEKRMPPEPAPQAVSRTPAQPLQRAAQMQPASAPSITIPPPAPQKVQAPMVATTTVIPPPVMPQPQPVPTASATPVIREEPKAAPTILREAPSPVPPVSRPVPQQPAQQPIPQAQPVSRPAAPAPSGQPAPVFREEPRMQPVSEPAGQNPAPSAPPAYAARPVQPRESVPPTPIWSPVPDAPAEIPPVASAFRSVEPANEQIAVQDRAMPGMVRIPNPFEQISANDGAQSFAPETPLAAPVIENPYDTHAAYAAPAQIMEEKSSFILPSINLLDEPPDDETIISDAELSLNSQRIEQILANFRLSARVVGAIPGPVITQYRVQPREGTRGSKFVQISKDLARGLGQPSVRVVENIGEVNCLGLEVPNAVSQNISLIEIIDSKVFYESKSKLTLALGKSITGDPIVTDLTKAPHLLVAGSTGSGKSVGINAMILSMIFKCTPEDLRLVLIDPKQVEFAPYEHIPHLLTEVVTDMTKAVHALQWCVKEMERRYSLMKAIGVRNIESYHEKLNAERMRGSFVPNPNSLTPENPEPMPHLPYIVVIVDELADLLGNFGKQVLPHIQSLTQKARAAGLHMILATQRPSNDIIPPVIKANCPTRISFRVSNRYDSMTILGGPGAEDLLGRGDMFFVSAGRPWERIHGAYVTDEEIMRITDFLRSQGEPEYVEGVTEPVEEPEEEEIEEKAEPTDDPLYDKACEIVLRERKISISYLQRRLAIGYNRAANIVERMERDQLVSKASESGKRQVLAPAPDSLL